MSVTTEEDLAEKMSELYVAECMAAKARLEVETECRRIIADNYEKVIGQVRDFSKKLEAPISAKICEVGYFCDAHVVRTNQVTMEMGASYYTECSLHTAEKIVARRVAQMRENREGGLESIRIIDEKIKFAKENFSSVSIEGGPIEIVEKYDEEMEKLFYDTRKKRKESREGEKKEDDVSTKDKADEEHAKMMDRLAELEKLEENGDDEEVSAPKPFEISTSELEELEEVEEEEDASDRNLRFGMNERLLAQPGVSQKEMERLLEFLDACDEESSDEELDEEIEELEENETAAENKVEELDSDDYASDDDKSREVPAKKVLKKVEEVNEKPNENKRKKSGVRFAQQLEKVKTFHQTDTVEIKEETVVETKSILRSTEPTPVDHSALEPEKKELAAMSTMSFPGDIVEKDPYDCEPSTSKDPAPVITEGKVSKFRASRHKN